MRPLFATGQKEAAFKGSKRMQQLPALHPRDPDWRRLKYSRSAADFGVACTGPQSEAEALQRAGAPFLREEPGLKLSAAKTLITHARSQAAPFLGDEITTMPSATKHRRSQDRFKRRSSTGKVARRVPGAVMLEQRKRSQQAGKPVQRTKLLQERDCTSSATYQLAYRG